MRFTARQPRDKCTPPTAPAQANAVPVQRICYKCTARAATPYRKCGAFAANARRLCSESAATFVHVQRICSKCNACVALMHQMQRLCSEYATILVHVQRICSKCGALARVSVSVIAQNNKQVSFHAFVLCRFHVLLLCSCVVESRSRL